MVSSDFCPGGSTPWEEFGADQLCVPRLGRKDWQAHLVARYSWQSASYLSDTDTSRHE